MKRLEWNLRTVATVSLAILLTVSVGGLGGWLLLSGHPGTGMMESNGSGGMMAATAVPDRMMGIPASRGILGGYTGAVGLVMIVLFVAMVSVLLYALFHERPGQPQPAVCGHCGRPIEVDWATCPYCGEALPTALS
jgi:hypothetical protein